MNFSIFKRFNKWRDDEGLLYKGWFYWWAFKLLKKYRLHFIVPFYFTQEDYDDGYQFLNVWRWGRYTSEVYEWRNYSHDYFYKASDNRVFNSRNLYRFINVMAKRIK